MASSRLRIAVGCALALALASPATVLYVRAVETPLGSTGFELEGLLGKPRSGPTASTLSDERVLVVGGKSSGTDVLASAELWDSASASFASTGSLAEARTHHSATLLPDGRVLVIGGDSESGPIAAAELYDPANDSFASAGTLSMARSKHTATLLLDGRVLVVGGEDELGPVASVELWDPASESFDPGGTLARARSNHTASLLPDGRVLVVGGDGEEEDVAPAELWDPSDRTFAMAGTLSLARSDHSASVLPGGRVLVAGGLDDGFSDPTATTELWDPLVDDFEPAAPLAEARYWHTATPLADGSVLIVGGLGKDEIRLDSAERWDPVVDTFEPAGTMSQARGAHAAALLPGDRVLVVGGLGEDGRLDSAEVWGIVPAEPASPSTSPDQMASAVPSATSSPMPEPTRSLSRPAMEAELAESMGWATWAPYRKSPAGAAFDPFEAGAKAGVIFDDLEQELHRAVDYIVLFRFPSRRSLDLYWSERADAAASGVPSRAEPCRDGRPGRGAWSDGEYLCYVSDSGTALLRWTDERTDTYGVMNAVAGRSSLKTLYAQWQAAIGGPGTSVKPGEAVSPRDVTFNASERLLLRGVPARIKPTCMPARDGVPTGTVAAVRCTPADAAVGSVIYHLMEKPKANRVFSRQLQKTFGEDLDVLGLWRCDQGEPGWEPSVPYGSDACYFGDDGRAQLRIVSGVTIGCTQLKVADKWLREPVVYMVVEGVDGDLAGLFESAGSGGGRLWRLFDQKGSPPSDMCPH